MDFYDWLAKSIKIDGISSVERDTAFDDMPNYRGAGIRLSYDSVTEKGLREGVLLEVGFDTVASNTPKDISSWVYDYAAGNVYVFNHGNAILGSSLEPGDLLRLICGRLMNDDPVRHHTRAFSILGENIAQETLGLCRVQIRLPFPTLVVLDVCAFEDEWLNVGRICLGDTCIDQMTTSFLHVMERNADETDVPRKIGRAPRYSAHFVINRSRYVSGTCRETLTFVIRAIDRVSPKKLYGDGFVMHHGARLDRAIEGAEKQVVGHRVERFSRLQFIRRRLKERELVAFLFCSQDFKRVALFRRKPRVRYPQITKLWLHANYDAVWAVISEQAAYSTVEYFNELVEGFARQRILQGTMNIRIYRADKALPHGKLAVQGAF
ncbi:hypothetical protein [Bradyrhizobium sp. ARR65]|uniref:hypothetical protein n=1 Tax=Bradyrhizobium sp. ARR65 TaxID=1040989 RepID=UPI0006867741|nr:hypothetical protein [Bradyrhizobium sp. ARR65]